MIRRIALALLALLLAGNLAHSQYAPGRLLGQRAGFSFLNSPSSNLFPLAGSVVDYDWANNRFSGPPINVSRASLASVAGPDGLITQAEPNTARVEYEPKAGAPRKNWIRNSTMYGGVAGSPGTTPTNHNIGGGAGLTRTLAFGTLSGIPYMDVTFAGTTSASTNVEISFDGNNAIPAWAGQAWAASSYIQVTKDDPALTSLSLQQVYINAAGSGETTVRTQNNVYATRATWQNYSVANPSIPAGTGTAYIRQSISTNAIPTGTAVNFTIRVGAPQLEQSIVSTAWIPTTTGAAEAGGRVNYIRNSVGQGTGTLPDFWGQFTNSGISAARVGSGTENGQPYVDIRFSGTATGGGINLYFDQANATLASVGQTWTLAANLRHVAGSLTNVSNSYLVITEINAAVNATLSQGASSNILSGLTSGGRFQFTRTFASAGATYTQPTLNFNFAPGPVDFTLRISAPQNEQGASATPWIATSGFPVSADSPRTNWVRNSAAIGAVPGVMGSGGVAPLFWSLSAGATGVTAQIVGSDPAGEFLDVRWSGTTTGTDWATSNAPVTFEGTTTIPANAGQTWSISAGIDVVGGALPSGFIVQLDNSERTSAGGLAGGRAVAITPGPGRSSVTATLGNSGTAFVQPMIRMGFTSPAPGRVVDFTLRIRKPQLEQRGAASDPILTTGIALTTDVERRNLVRNSAATGVTVGSQNLPAGWSGATAPVNGITRTVAGLGTNLDGTPYIDFRFSGTSTATGANLIGNIFTDFGTLAASPGQTTVTHSLSAALVAGSLPPTSATPVFVIERAATTTAWSSQPMALTGTLTRFAMTVTPTDAGLTGLRPSFWVYGPTTPGTAVDFTLRISVPQFEVSPYATPPIITTGSAITIGPGSAYSRGLLIEGSQTNYIANNAMLGAVLGGSNGSGNPNGWSGSLNGFGLTSTIVAMTQQRGLDCIDTRVFGTTNAAAVAILYFGPTADQIAAVPGQLHTLSAYTALVGGSFANLSGLDLTIRENGAGTAFLRQTLGSVMNPSTFSRTVLNVTTGANTTGVATGIRLVANAGVVIDFTLRLCSPQAERWDPSVTTVGGASSVIRTTGTVAARAADNVTANLSGFGVPLTVAGLVRSSPFALANAGVIARIGTGPSTGFRALLNPNAGSLVGGETGFSGVDLGAQPPAGSRFAFAFAGDQSGQAGSLNGGNVVSIGTGLTLGHTFLGIGSNGDGSAPIWGNVERLVIWPYRTPANDNLRSYGSVGNLGN